MPEINGLARSADWIESTTDSLTGLFASAPKGEGLKEVEMAEKALSALKERVEELESVVKGYRKFFEDEKKK